MEKLLSVSDIMARYQCSRQTAIRYMRQMEHQERPYMVTEKALRAWEQSRTVNPPELIRAEMRRQKVMRRFA
jgi:hypothetical protein